MSAILHISPEEATRTTVEQAILEWRAQREKRLEADKVAEGLKKQETALKNWIISVLRSQLYEGIIIDGKATGLSTKEVPVCEDRSALTQYILDNRAIELLEFRLSKKAVEDYVEAGHEVPGINFIEVYDLFNRKA
jgi:hypothetical protein